MSLKNFDVFLSYKSDDRDLVERLKDGLIERGVRVWLDKDQIRPGDLFAEALANDIENSRSVGLVVTPNSIAEIGTLIQLKEHYAGQAKQLRSEVEAKQDVMDKTYLRAVSFSSETIYALNHIKGMEPGPDRKALESIKADLKQLPKEAAARMENVPQRYELMGQMIDASRGLRSRSRKPSPSFRPRIGRATFGPCRPGPSSPSAVSCSATPQTADATTT